MRREALHGVCMVVVAMATLQGAESEEFHTVVCQDHEMSLQCPEGEVLVFDTANYGRTDTKLCAVEAESQLCDIPVAVTKLNNWCFGRPNCTLTVGHAAFPSVRHMCPGVKSFYLEIRYSCVKPSQIHPICDPDILIPATLTGYVISPGYPAEYAHEQMCIKELDNRGLDKVKVEILDVDIEYDGNVGCKDFLFVKERDLPQEKYLYCESLERNMKQRVNHFLRPVFHFETDGDGKGRGFLVKFHGPHRDKRPHVDEDGLNGRKLKFSKIIVQQRLAEGDWTHVNKAGSSDPGELTWFPMGVAACAFFMLFVFATKYRRFTRNRWKPL
nr:Gal-binding and CUB domains containing receptor 19 [Arenicola marina]